MRVRSRHFAKDNYTGPRSRRFLQILGSVFRQQLEPLPFGQMAWRDHLKIPAVKGGDLVQVEPLGERYHTCIHGLKPQRRVGGEQFSHPSVVMLRDLDDTELVVGDGGAELSGQTDAAAPLRIGQQMTDLGDGKRRDHQARPVPGEELHAPGMIPVSLMKAATSGPVSHKITRTLLRWPHPGQGRPGTCHDYGQGPAALSARRQALPGAAEARESHPAPGLHPQPPHHRS